MNSPTPDISLLADTSKNSHLPLASFRALVGSIARSGGEDLKEAKNKEKTADIRNLKMSLARTLKLAQWIDLALCSLKSGDDDDGL